MPENRGKTVLASFTGHNRSVQTKPIVQYDYGQILKIIGLDLPFAFECHFVAPGARESVTQIGGTDEDGTGTVTIPDDHLLKSGTVKAYIFLHEGDDDGETEYTISIGVLNRPQPSDLEPTPVQQDAITQAIAALDNAVDVTTEKAQDATDQAQIAIDQASDASTFAANARESELNAKASEEAAAASESVSLINAQAAAVSASAAAESESTAEEYADRAEQAAALSGYLHFEIINGHLMMDRTPNVNVDFYQQDGHLFVTD